MKTQFACAASLFLALSLIQIPNAAQATGEWADLSMAERLSYAQNHRGLSAQRYLDKNRHDYYVGEKVVSNNVRPAARRYLTVTGIQVFPGFQEFPYPYALELTPAVGPSYWVTDRELPDLHFSIKKWMSVRAGDRFFVALNVNRVNAEPSILADVIDVMEGGLYVLRRTDDGTIKIFSENEVRFETKIVCEKPLKKGS